MNPWPERLRALISYAYITDDNPLPSDVDLLVDSGAFTAHTKGKEIRLGDYIDYLGRHAGEYRAAFALDVIGNHDASLRNYRTMRRNLPDSVGLIPTWHVGGDWAQFRALLDEGAPTVAVGGAVAHALRQSALMRTFVACHKHAADAGVRLHGLGQTSALAMKLPWESVDSTSWTYPRKYPMCLLARRDGTIKSLTRGKPLSPADRHLVKSYGLDPRRVSSPTRTPISLVTEMAVQAVRSYIYTEQATPHDTRVHLVYGAPSDLDIYLRPAWAAGSPHLMKEQTR